MNEDYFNFSTYSATSWWERRTFRHRWWQLGRHDWRWSPPYYPRLQWLLEPGKNTYLAQFDWNCLYSEAFPRHGRGAGTLTAYFEETVAAAVVMTDQRQAERVGYLVWLHCVNNEDALDRLLGKIMEQLWAQGVYRLVGPVGPSPFLQSGVLQNYFHLDPPLHTAYNPPYLPELLESSLTPWQHSLLYDYLIPTDGVTPVQAHPIRLSPLIPSHLADQLLPLWQIACQAAGDFPAPDGDYAHFMIQWLQDWPLWGWQAIVDDVVVGFVLLQPDLGNALRRANGGRHLGWRWWLQWRSRRPTPAGRLLYGAVAPSWQGQGIGTLLWQQALWSAHQQGWRRLTIGPVLVESAGAVFLEQCGAQPQQRYTIYRSE